MTTHGLAWVCAPGVQKHSVRLVGGVCCVWQSTLRSKASVGRGLRSSQNRSAALCGAGDFAMTNRIPQRRTDCSHLRHEREEAETLGWTHSTYMCIFGAENCKNVLVHSYLQHYFTQKKKMQVTHKAEQECSCFAFDVSIDRGRAQPDIKMVIGAKLADRASLKNTPTAEQTVSALWRWMPPP